jgi:hypothetical protein
LITARDMAMAVAPVPRIVVAPLTERVLLVVLFVTVLASSVAFIEPSPHDALMGVLALACVAAGVRFERALVLPFLLLLVWNIAGLMSLIGVADQDNTIQYTGTSIYLALAAILFACLFAENTMARLAAMRVAYIATAVIAALAGIAGYFHAFPGAFEFFTQNERALGTFKDPNVFGPFLIWPALYVMTRIISRGIGARDIAILGSLVVGLLLSFSRGAWISFTIASTITVAILMMTAPSPQIRLRIVGFCLLGLFGLAVFFVLLLSLDSVRQMFETRAQALQSYDVGEGGRFHLQELALSGILNFPNAFIVYGWVGGIAYILLLLATLWVAVRTVFVSTPWQPYLITAFAAFTGSVVEGFVIDTDHWRHFFLLLGIIWGLFVATVKYQRQQSR